MKPIWQLSHHFQIPFLVKIGNYYFSLMNGIYFLGYLLVCTDRCLFLSAKILRKKKNRANSNTVRSCENKYAWVNTQLNINKHAALDRLSGSPKLSIPRTIKTDYVLEGLWGGWIRQNQWPLDRNFMGNLLTIFLSSLWLPLNASSKDYNGIFH